MTCCQLISGKAGVPSPFCKIISFSYYDGTTSGAAMCGVCGREYFYDLLSLDDNQDVRIYGFSSIQAGSLGDLTEICSRFDTPKWPEWHPKPGVNDRGRKEFRAKIGEIRKTKTPPQLVVASEELSKLLLLAKAVHTAELLSDMPDSESPDAKDFTKWLAFLKS